MTKAKRKQHAVKRAVKEVLKVEFEAQNEMLRKTLFEALEECGLVKPPRKTKRKKRTAAKKSAT